jgi:DNA-binding response OmpR family regulator
VGESPADLRYFGDMTKVLVVDDEAGIRESLCYALQRDGFEAVQLDRLARVEAELPGAALLVLEAPGSGCAARARGRGAATPTSAASSEIFF